MTVVVILFLIVAVVVFGVKAVYIVRPYEKALVERLGKFNRTEGPGLALVIPFIETLIQVDMREQVIDVQPQQVITKENVGVTVDAVVYFQVTDPFRVVYNVAEFEIAVLKLAQTNLRQAIGELDLDETLTSRETVNKKLKDILDEATDKWGVKVTRVEMQKIDPPDDISDAMSRQMKAERERRAVILDAEGIKKAAVLKAEGDKQAIILKAEGQAQAVRKTAEAEKFRQATVAEGEGQAIERVFAAIHNGKPTQDLLAIKYLESLTEISKGSANKIFLPYEISGVLGAMGAMAETFAAKTKDVKKKIKE